MLFLQGNFAALLGLLGFVTTALLWRWAKEPQLRRDLLGTLGFFGVYLLLREGAAALGALVPTEWDPYVRVVWLLAFSYGTVRLSVSLALFARRAWRPGPSAKIQRDVLDFLLYLVCTVPILKTQLKIDITTILGTSAVLSLVLGFALQDTLSNLFAGISLQFERPFDVGDFIRVGEHEGRVVQLAWRSTRLETVRREFINFPNSELAKAHVISYSGSPAVGVDLTFDASYAAAPSVVKTQALESVREVALILADPGPTVRVREFGESGVGYVARVFVRDIATLPQVKDELYSRLWYRFGRLGIEIPYPQRVLHMRSEQPAPRPREREVEAMLRRLELFEPFGPAELEAIVSTARFVRFGAGEAVVTEGEAGATFYLVVSGTLSVQAGAPARDVGRLGRGEGFGEMSLLTGEPRAATVRALDDVWLLELDREGFGRHFLNNPQRAEALAALIDRRRAALASPGTVPAPEGRRARTLDRLRELFRL